MHKRTALFLGISTYVIGMTNAIAQPEGIELAFEGRISQTILVKMGTDDVVIKNLLYKGKPFRVEDGLCSMAGLNVQSTFGDSEGMQAGHIKTMIAVVYVKNGDWVIAHGGGRKNDEYLAQCFLDKRDKP